jgi:type II secretory pathway component GspD/PulD (secretin)
VNEVAAFRSAGGSVTANPTAGTITVTDTPAVLARIETFIKEFNRRAGRQVALKFDYYSIKRTRANQLGLEVNGVFTTPNGTVRTFLQSPGSLLDNTAALAQGNVLPGANKTVPTPGRPGTIGDGLKNGEGSSLGLGAVASWDDAVRIGGYSLIAKNNVSQAFTESDFQEYPRSISSTQSNTSTETQIQQGSITTGFAGYFLARITDDNRVNLRFGMDISDPPKLSPTSAGNTTIQSASVSRKAPVIDVLIVPGRPVPILQMTQRKAANRTNLGFGGSTTDNDTDSDLLLVVTATLLN